MPSLLLLLSAATELPLTDGSSRTTGLWPEELAAPHEVFADAGIATTIATPGGGKASPDPTGYTPESTGYSAAQCDEIRRYLQALQPELDSPAPLDSIDPTDFDAAFIPGGHAPIVDLWADPECGRVLSGLHYVGKPIAAVWPRPSRAAVGGRRGVWRVAVPRLQDDRLHQH